MGTKYPESHSDNPSDSIGISKSHKILDSAICLLLLALAFCLSMISGERGYMPLDHSMMFDGGYRIFSGQVPFSDFVIAHGLVPFWLMSVFFKLFGVNYLSCLLGAAFFNILATICSIVILRLFFPSKKWLSYIAGLLTAVWFYPPYGILYVDQTAFFVCLLSLTLFLFAVRREEKHSSMYTTVILLICGCLMFVAFFCKQNVGVLFLPAPFLILLVVYLPDFKKIFSRAAVLMTGFTASLALFLIWVLTKANIDIFLRHYIEIPFSLGVNRLQGTERISGFLFNNFLGPTAKNAAVLISFFAAVFMFILYLHNKKSTNDIRWPFLGCMVCIYLVLFQYIFCISTLNQPENGQPFLGIILTLGIGQLFYFSDKTTLKPKNEKYDRNWLKKNVVKNSLISGIVLLTLFVARDGVKVSLDRTVHDIFTQSKFPEYCRIEKLKNLKWGQPTKYPHRPQNTEIKEEDLIGLYEFLDKKVKKKGKRFFIFPDFTVFYGLLDIPSPQPVAWFHRDLTYARNSNSSVDKWIVDSLEKNMVEFVVLEKVSWFGNLEENLNDFPQLRNYSENYRRIRKIGIFYIYKNN